MASNSRFGVLFSSQVASSLVGAVQRDDRDTLCSLLKDPTVFGCDDLAKALHVAANYGFDECMSMLLEAKAMPDIHDLSGCTPIILAAKKGHQQVVSLLIRAGCNIDKASFRVRATALHWAATNDHLGCVQILLEAGANIEARTMHGRTPLMLAARADNADIVEELIDAGATVNRADHVGETSLHLASEEGSTDCVRLLLRAKADVNAKKRNGDTAIMLAAQGGHGEVIRQLIRQPHIDVSGRSRELSVLHWAASGGSATCLELLLKYGSDPNLATQDSYAGSDLVVEEGVTPLMLACRGGHQDAVKLLVSYGCSLDKSDSLGYTALLYAVKSDSASCADLLISSGADSNGLCMLHSGDRALSPLFLAIKENSIETLKVLLRANCKVNLLGFDQKGEPVTPFEMALVEGKIDVCRMLLIGGGQYRACNGQKVATGLASLFEKDEEMFHLLVRELYAPPLLIHLSRKQVRDAIGQEFQKAVQSLAVPSSIRKFLLLQELDDF